MAAKFYKNKRQMWHSHATAIPRALCFAQGCCAFKHLQSGFCWPGCSCTRVWQSHGFGERNTKRNFGLWMYMFVYIYIHKSVKSEKHSDKKCNVISLWDILIKTEPGQDLKLVGILIWLVLRLTETAQSFVQTWHKDQDCLITGAGVSTFYGLSKNSFSSEYINILGRF